MYQMSQCYNVSGSASSFVRISPLEYITRTASVQPETVYHAEVASLPQKFYASPRPSFSSVANTSYSTAIDTMAKYTQSSTTYSLNNTHREYNFIPDNFLKPGKEGQFVGKADEIKEHIEQAFELMFHSAFPSDIKISVLNSEEFRKLAPHGNTVGLSINRRPLGLLSEIFVLNGPLARVMLTIGHEIGHVLTKTLDDKHEEEAKAYAFSLAWMKSIQENDIAGLGDSFVQERPAENGLHDVAFAFVEKTIRWGKSAWDVYQELISGLGEKRVFNVAM